VAPMSRISYSFTPNHYILRARCVRHAVRGMKGCWPTYVSQGC